MPRRDRRRLWLASLIVVAGVVLVGQMVAGRDLIGPLGTLVLPVPALALAAMLGATRRAWPERLLTCLALIVALLVLAGIVAALSPRGLDARSVAAVELGLVAAAVVAWVGLGADRSRDRSDTRAPASAGRQAGASAAASAGTRAGVSALSSPTARDGTRRRRPSRPRLVLGIGSVALVLLGLVLGGAGYAIATQAAHAAADVGVVQFWSTPATTGREAQVGVGNQTGETLSCSVQITRRGHGTAKVTISPLAPGQSWSSGLPPADASETTLWQLDLTCTGDQGEITRRLLIDPPPATTE
jgi:hypothetical protein